MKTVKLLAQSTGEFTRDELKKDVKFAWTDKAKAEIAAAKGENANGGDSSQSGNGGTTPGGNTGGNPGGNTGGGGDGGDDGTGEND